MKRPEQRHRLRYVARASWLVFLMVVACAPRQEQFGELRERMVREQIEGRGVRDSLTLAAMRKVPRHQFVPKDRTFLAYSDGALPIGYGQTISQPYVVAFMTELIRPRKEFKVLEVGTGSGYQAAVLAEIVDSVFSIEIVPELASSAAQRLKSLGYSNVVTRQGDGYLGWPGHGPYDAILVTAAPDHIPRPLIDQLKDGGVMVIPVGPVESVQELKLVRKEGENTITETKMPVRFVPLVRDR